MADPVGTTPFKYVTVDQDDDELVIEAGLRAPNDVKAVVSESDEGASPVDDEAKPAHVHEQTSENAKAEPASGQASAATSQVAATLQAAAATSQTAATLQSAAAGKGPSDKKRAKEADAAYRETTLDDLKHEPMPKMQRAVLAGIAVLVIVFVAYVLFF